MKKSSKIMIATLVIIVAGALALIIANYTSLNFVKFQCENYLSQKYDADKSEFELIDYKKFHSYWDDYNIFYPTLKWTDFSFEYKYNDKLFFVNRIDGKFYDDYQIDDVEKWCTEWLQNNIDERITGIEIKSGLLRGFCKDYKKDNSYVFKATDAFDIINYSNGYIEYNGIYYKDENLANQTDQIKEEEKLKDKFDNKFGSDNTVVFISQSRSIQKTRGKGDDSLWSYFINEYM